MTQSELDVPTFRFSVTPPPTPDISGLPVFFGNSVELSGTWRSHISTETVSDSNFGAMLSFISIGYLRRFPARAHLCLQEGNEASHQHVRARPTRPLSHQRMGVQGRQYPACRPDGRVIDASDGKACPDDRRRNQGRFWAQRHRSRSFRRIGLDPDCRRQDRPQGVPLRT